MTEQTLPDSHARHCQIAIGASDWKGNEIVVRTRETGTKETDKIGIGQSVAKAGRHDEQSK